MRIGLIALFFVLATLCAKADEVATITLKNDSTFTGTVVSNTATEIVLRFKDGTERSFRRITISDIAYAEKKTKHQRQVENLVESPPHFSCFGATIGRQGLLNLRGGVHDSSFATHISGMFWSKVVGVQVNLMWCFWQQNHTQHYLSAMAGYSYADMSSKFLWYEAGRNEWTFEGVGYVLHSRAFLCELGVGWPNGTTAKPQVLLQIGWVPKTY